MNVLTPTHSTLIDLLSHQAQRQPDKLAATFLSDGINEQSNLSYAALDMQARAIAVRLYSLDASRQRALLLYPPGLEFLAAFCGCLYAGTIAIPAPPPDLFRLKRTLPRLQAIISDAQPTLVLTTAALMASLRETDEVRTLFDLAYPLQWLATDQADQIDATGASQWQPPEVSHDNLAYLQYTSGSTSAPRGVMISHSNLMHQASYISQTWKHDLTSVSVTWMPHFHDYGLVEGLIVPLYTGTRVYSMSPVSFMKRPLRWLQAIARYRASRSAGPDFAYAACVQKITPAQRDMLDLSCWRGASCGAEPIRAETLRQFAHFFAPCGFQWDAFYPAYGLAECTLSVSLRRQDAQPTLRTLHSAALKQHRVVEAVPETVLPAHSVQMVVGCGHPLGDTHIVIANPDSLVRCAENEVGEVWVAGACVAQGYWNQAQASASTFGASLRDTGQGPFLRTGDLGFLCDGELFITGRQKDMLIVGGVNHYPHDIEWSVQHSHPAIRAAGCAAFSVPVAQEERLVIAAEVQRAGLDVTAAFRAIRQAATEYHELETYAIVLLHSGGLPRTSSGKIQRALCRDRFLAGSLETLATWKNQRLHVLQNPSKDINSSAPEQELQALQQWLCQRLATYTGAAPEQIDMHEPLAQYGLSSRTMVSLLGELEAHVDMQLSPVLLFQYPTIDQLSRHVLANMQHQPQVWNTHGTSTLSTEHEPIAIVGMGCRFPGAENPQAFWDLLCAGSATVGEMPDQRWDIEVYYDPSPDAPGKMYTRQGSFLEQVDMFDAAFFGIAPREAVSIDPQQRLLLEVSWEALEHAGLPPHKLKGSRTGVFIGISGNDYAHLLLRNSSDPDAYLGTGNANSIAANRLSYMFDFRGPSLAIDTACSSSLVALHTACESLRLHQCDMALAGGVSLMLLPEVAVSLCRARMLAADGRCKTFDAAADGYGRGEGAGIVVLKRLSNALRHQDPILALVRGSAINHDGRSSGLTAPNGLAQQAVMRAALSYANVSPGSIGYVEAHGTGTPLGDPVEIDSLKAVLSEERAVGQGCAIGSVKTNIGHLEAAAGIAGFIKTVLALQNEAIPAHLHLRELNPYISLEQTELSIPITHSPWPRSAGRRLAGVSSFGFGGTNCHVVLEEAPASQAAQPGNLPRDARPLHLLALSARSELALRALARKYAALLAQDDAPALVDCCYTANCGRSHFNQRLVVTGAVAAQVGEELDAFARGHPTVHLRKSYVHCSQPPGIVFLFSGQGAQFIDMGRQLYETHPTFRAIIEHCDTLLRPVLKRSLVDVLYPAPGARSPLNETQYTQPALFTLEYALARLLQSWGIEPAALLGHSIGEYVAACVAGIFSLEDGLHLVSERGRLMQAMPHSGSMAAIFTSEARVAAELAHYSSTLSIAAINSTTETVISGESQAVQAVVASLSHEGISARFLNVSHAFHSHIMEPMLDQFEQAAARVTCYPPGMQLLSNLNGQPLPGDMPPPARYWRRHVREPVQFAAGIETLWQQGYRYFVEIGPHPTLLSLVRQCEPSSEATFLAVLHRGQQDWQQLFDAIGTLYLAGLNIEWERLDSDYDRCRVALPTYSFQRTRYWPGTVTTLAHPSSPHQPSGMAESQQPADNTNRFARYRMLVARPDERQTMLTDYLVQLIAHVLKVPAASLDAQQPISELLIIDSLMAAELRHRIETDLSIAVSLSVFYQEVSIAQLAGMLLQQDSFAVITPVHARYLLSIIDALSYQQAASLLARLRDV